MYTPTTETLRGHAPYLLTPPSALAPKPQTKLQH